jgi:hypothetical protein
MELYLSTADNSIDSPYISKAFYDEIISEWYIKFADFLTEDEVKIVRPNILGEITIGQKKEFKLKDQSSLIDKIANVISGKQSAKSVNAIFDEFLITSTKIEDRERDPELLKSTLQKIEDYLQENADTLPLMHSLYDSETLENEVERITIDGIEALVEGDLFYDSDYANIRNKLQIKSYYDDFEKINLKLTVTPEIVINNKTYYTKSISKASHFKYEFKQCYDFLNQAIAQNIKVLWEFG